MEESIPAPLTLDISEGLGARLEREARRLGVTPDELAERIFEKQMAAEGA